MGDITLTSAVRENLSSLQNTADLLNRTQNRLATGNKVNSALDNPSSFFTASGLQNRANDLSGLLDDIGQSVQTLRAADEGIKSITKLAESAKAKANQALQTNSQAERRGFAQEYNELLTQLEDIAKDASFGGKNLLGGAGNDLTVIFNETNTSKLEIGAVDFTDTTNSDGLNLQDLTEGSSGAVSFQLAGGSATETSDFAGLKTESLVSDSSSFEVGDVLQLETLPAGSGSTVANSSITISADTTVQDVVDTLNGVAGVEVTFDEADGSLTINSSENVTLRNTDGGAATPSPTDLLTVSASNFSAGSDLLAGSGGISAGDTLTFTDGNGFEVGTLEVDETTTVNDLTTALSDGNGVTASFNSGTGQITVESDVDLTISSDNANFNSQTGFVADTNGGVQLNADDSGFASDSDIEGAIDRVNAALNTLRSQASTFGTNLSIVENRQGFTRNLISTLESGAGKLTLADTNVEGANLLALQTRQQLSSSALSLAAQADRNVLSLIR
ncbi:flagellin [Coralliovum pocilloporae]|uniref:flagellin N-terminal helical domain-containing protein n=1 Tax=Coralliovum pocilloporae TaxID=3066369 RepID=UPI0033079FC2